MADQDAYFHQAPNISPLCIGHEEFGDDMPLMGLSSPTIDGPLPNVRSNEVNLNTKIEDSAADSTA
jgi:hypothetical protein